MRALFLIWAISSLSVVRVAASWEVSPGPQGELDGAPVNCNLYHYKNFGFNPFNTKDTFPPQVLDYSPTKNGTVGLDRFWRKSELLIYNEKVFLVDNLNGGDGLSLVAIHLQDFAEIYRTAEFHYYRQNDISSLFHIVDGVDLWHYLKRFQERVLVLALERSRITHLFAAESLVVWSEEDEYRPNRYLIRSYDESTRTTMTLASKQGNDHDISYNLPSACENWVVSQKFDHSTNQSMIWMYNSVTDTSEQLIGSSGVRNYIYPKIFSVDQAESLETSKSCGGCVLTWLETGESVRLDDDGEMVVLTDSGGLEDAIIHSLELPCRRYMHSLEPTQWHRAVDQSGEQQEDMEFSVLLDFMASGDYIFFLLGKPGNQPGSVEKYKVRSFYILTGDLEDIRESVSDYPLSFHGAHDQGLLIWQHRQTLKVLLLLKIGFVRDAEMTTFCTILQTSNTTTAALHKDIVVWMESGGDQNGAIKMLDLNKDNDLLFDTVDRFPMDSDHMWDSDNDEIGDASDLIRARGKCKESLRRGACFSDLGLLYILWAFFVTIVAIMTCFGSRWYAKHKEMVKQASLQHEMEARGNAPDERRNSLATGGAHRNSAIHREARRGSTVIDSRRLSDMIAIVKQDDEEEEDQDGKPVFSVIKVELIEMACHVVVLSMTIVSLVIATVPFWSPNPPTLRQRQIFMWIDFFITYIFLVDLVARFVVRDREVERTVFQFLKGNWPDVLALTTDIPGVTNMGAIRFLVITRFRHVLRLFRITRILKVFRVVRFYRRFTMQNWFIELMINRPTLFLLLLLCLILIISASFLKILEQNRQESFQSLVNTLWFTLVTITTVGYGDMVPLNVVSRMITAGLMMVGIGILGLLTATLLKKLLMGGQGMAEMEKRKQQNRVRLDLLKTNAAKMTMAYNPMVTVYGEYFSRMFENDSQIREANSAHKSSYLNHDKSVMEDTVMPLEVMMARSATKFRASTQDSSALQDHEIEARNRGARERDILRSLFDDPSAPAISPEIKLHFILRFFKLDEGKDAVKDFEAFHEDLKLILFNEHTPQNLFIARAMALQDEMDDSGNLPVGWKADLKDPIDSVLVRIEETLRRYNVHVRPDFQEIMLEFILLAFMHDRVLNASWALRNLKHTDGATKAFPPIKHGCVKSLGFKSTSWNLESQFSRQELIPKLTFVSRRANLSSTSNIKRNEKEALKKLVVPKLASVVSRVHHLRSINVDQAESSDAKSKWKLVKQKLMPPRRISPTSSEEDAIKATQSLNH